jgi:hypothetical protein
MRSEAKTAVLVRPLSVKAVSEPVNRKGDVTQPRAAAAGGDVSVSEPSKKRNG